jgi:hypothetical protein
MLRKTVIGLLAVVSIGLSLTGASARGGFGGHGFGGGGWHGGGWHGGGWRGPGFGPVAGGLIAGAVIGGVASSAYAWAPGYGYYGGYAPDYDRGCPERGNGEYYNCGSYAMPGYGAPAYYGYGYGPW